MKLISRVCWAAVAASILLAGCSFNPFSTNNRLTGSATGALAGTVIGAGGTAIFTSSKASIAAAGIGGGLIGYYVTTLRYASGQTIQSGGQVFQVGEKIGIYIPTDKLFEPNTAEFLPNAPAILDSVVALLERVPNHHIFISGNSSGFSSARREQILSVKRAAKVAGYLWDAGIGAFQENSNNTRKLTYVGYGNYFPLANTYTNKGIRSNSRIQITAYPTACELCISKLQRVFENVGNSKQDQVINRAPSAQCGPKGEC
jgi:outer membrane protein OmpA-like peptidoglycan-associated protein